MFKQIELSYDFKALEPHIDELTMITHYTKHHATYTNNLNANIEKAPEVAGKSIEEVLKNLDSIKDASVKTAIQNNGGGFYNHNLYFSTMSPNGGGNPVGEIAARIEKDFGSFDSLKEKLSAAGAARFGSGWAWLSTNKAGELKVTSTANQDNPLMEENGEWTPVLGIDVWEHAYYLKYKNVRADYLNAFFNVVDWNVVNDNYKAAIK